MAINDSFQAKATLKSLVDNFPLDEVKKQAAEKLKVIDDGELKKKPLEKTDTLENKN